MVGAVGTGIRVVACGPFTAAGRIDFVISESASFSSESSGATNRRASTSFSRRVNSISFCRNTSYTFFISRSPVALDVECNLTSNFSRVACVVKRFAARGLREMLQKSAHWETTSSRLQLKDVRNVTRSVMTPGAEALRNATERSQGHKRGANETA